MQYETYTNPLPLYKQKIPWRKLPSEDFFYLFSVYLLFIGYLVTISTGTLKIFATFRIVSMCLPVAAAKWWVGPHSLQRVTNSLAPQVKRVLMLVSPKERILPSSFTPSATTNLK